MPFSIQVQNLDEIRARVGPDLHQPAVRKAVKASLEDIRDEARRLAPVDTDRLRPSITYHLGRAPIGGSWGWVGSDLPYAAAVHEGRGQNKRPPPTRAIAAWLERRGGDPRLAFVVARAIGRRGIPARPFLTRALERSRREINAHLADAARAIERKWATKS